MDKKTAYLIVNFGGPRGLDEIRQFLTALLTDQDVLRTPFPPFIHRFIFSRVAKKRAKKISHDYELIGGKSPIYEDTEAVASQVQQILGQEILTFHRYLPATHADFFKACESLKSYDEILVFPMFPQFSYATTGSIARWFSKKLPSAIVDKIRWVRSYAEHPEYIRSFQQCISDCLKTHDFKEEETILLFSAHGVPKQFIVTGDPYQSECIASFQQIGAAFPKALHKLSYQSQFGKEEWIRPYTDEVCRTIDTWGKGYRNVVFIPLSFTSDHIETLFEVEQQYVPLCAERGFCTVRCPALNRRSDWIQTIATIFHDPQTVHNNTLIFRKNLSQ